MLKIDFTSEVAEGLRSLLDKEGDTDARFRIREFKIGCT